MKEITWLNKEGIVPLSKKVAVSPSMHGTMSLKEYLMKHVQKEVIS